MFHRSLTAPITAAAGFKRRKSALMIECVICDDQGAPRRRLGLRLSDLLRPIGRSAR